MRFSLLRRMEGVPTKKRKSFEIDAPPPSSNCELVTEEEDFSSNLEQHRRLEIKATVEYASQLREKINNKKVRIKLDKKVPVLAAASLELKAEKEDAHSDTIWSVGFSPDGKTIVSGSADQTLKVWDAGASAPTPSNP